MDQFVMPSLGADMDEGTVVEWLVKPGDPVHRGDPIAVVDTDKAAIEVECFVDGTVAELLVPEGQRVAVGTPLATINGAATLAGEPGRPAGPQVTEEPEEKEQKGEERKTREPKAKEPKAKEPKAAAAEGTRAPRRPKTRPPTTRPPTTGPPTTRPAKPAAALKPVVQPAAPGRRPASPYARKLARQRGLQITQIRNGMVTSRDVLAFVPPPAVPAATATEPDRMRAAIARLMARSKREIPHYYLSTTVDLGTALDWLRDHNRRVSVTDRVVPSALLLRATALAAVRHPELNGYWLDDRFQPADAVNLGVAVSLRRGGMVAPAILGADRLGVAELMARLRDLVSRARSGRLRGSEMEDPTITVTNLGDQGVESVQGVIYPPQVALVGFGKVVERPWAREGMLGVRPCVTVTLAADHRATDGFTGSRFLDTVDHLLQTPEEL
jgi:pyruvate dehydrogenase E2 component (dihydrolipoamide acetyltransferase)